MNFRVGGVLFGCKRCRVNALRIQARCMLLPHVRVVRCSNTALLKRELMPLTTRNSSKCLTEIVFAGLLDQLNKQQSIQLTTSISPELYSPRELT